MKNVLITGGSGFIGIHIVKKLCEIGEYNITIYDIKKNNIENINFIEGDILDQKKLIESTKKMDIIIHCAAICGILKIKENPKKFISKKELSSNKFRAISDFISGMTDRYAINLYNNIKWIYLTII